MIKSAWLFVSRNPRGASKVGFFAQPLDLATDELGWDVGQNQSASARNAKPCSMVKLKSWKQLSRNSRRKSKRFRQACRKSAHSSKWEKPHRNGCWIVSKGTMNDCEIIMAISAKLL